MACIWIMLIASNRKPFCCGWRKLSYFREIQMLLAVFNVARDKPISRDDLIEPRKLRLVGVAVCSRNF